MVLKLQFDATDLIDDIEGVTVYIVLGHVVVVLRVLHKCNLVAHFFVKEKTQCFSNRITVVGIHITVHIQYDRAVAYDR